MRPVTAQEPAGGFGAACSTLRRIRTECREPNHARRAWAARAGSPRVVVPDSIALELPHLTDAVGNPMRDLAAYRVEWEESFEFTFVDPDARTKAECVVWDALPAIFAAGGG